MGLEAIPAARERIHANRIEDERPFELPMYPLSDSDLGTTFVRFKPGQYMLALRCNAPSKRVNLVAYRGEGCKIKEVMNRQIVRDISEKISQSENSTNSQAN